MRKIRCSEIVSFRDRGGLGETKRDPSHHGMPTGPSFVQICARRPYLATIWAWSAHVRVVVLHDPLSFEWQCCGVLQRAPRPIVFPNSRIFPILGDEMPENHRCSWLRKLGSCHGEARLVARCRTDVLPNACSETNFAAHRAKRGLRTSVWGLDSSPEMDPGAASAADCAPGSHHERTPPEHPVPLPSATYNAPTARRTSPDKGRASRRR